MTSFDGRALLGDRTGQLFIAHGSTIIEVAGGDARPGTQLTTDHLFQCWCLTKPLLALAAHELHTQHDVDLAESLFCSPCLGGYVTAGAIGRLFIALLRLHEDGESPLLIDQEALTSSLEYRRGLEHDAVLDRDCDFSAGFTVDLSHHGFGHRVSQSAFGYVGWLGASFVLADPEFDLVVARICPRIQTDFAAVSNERGQFLDNLYAELIGPATGDIRIAG